MQEFPRVAAVRKSTSLRTLLGGKTSDQLVNQRVTADKGKFLARSSRGFFFFTCKRKFWLSHIQEETPLTKHPSCSTEQVATQQQSGLTCHSRFTEKQPPDITGRSSSGGRGPFSGPCACRRESFHCSEGRCAPAKPHCSPPSSPEEQVATA